MRVEDLDRAYAFARDLLEAVAADYDVASDNFYLSIDTTRACTLGTITLRFHDLSADARLYRFVVGTMSAAESFSDCSSSRHHTASVDLDDGLKLQVVYVYLIPKPEAAPVPIEELLAAKQGGAA